MAIVTTINPPSAFIDAFARMDRMDGWTYDGLRALYDYLDDLSEACDTHIELDVVAICCEYSEHESALACIADNGYSWEPDPDDDADDQEEAALEWLQDNTSVCVFDGGIIIAAF